MGERDLPPPIAGMHADDALERHERGWRGAARAMGRALLDTTLPAVCAGCGISGSWLCRDCRALVRRIDPLRACERCGLPNGAGEARCRRCGTWPADLSACRSVFEFDGPVREAIHRLKYRHESARAEWCARVMARALIETGWRAHALVPVPLHASRERVRGYNQSERIATQLGSAVGLPVADILMRTRSTGSQVGLAARERRENVRDAFAARRELAGRTVILIDDVVTTGATIVECARACRAAGAASVTALTLACDVTPASR